MKEMLLQLARHHEWANKVFFKKLSTVSPEILNKDMGSSFSSINKTLFHILTAERIWWQRIQLSERIVLPDESLSDNFEAISSDILQITANWVELVKESNENRLQHVFGYYNSKKEFFKQPLYEVLLHLFNHQTYHHGQIITMLRQQKLTKLPATDFIKFSRTKGRI